jgi:hypothetical protein
MAKACGWADAAGIPRTLASVPGQPAGGQVMLTSDHTEAKEVGFSDAQNSALPAGRALGLWPSPETKEGA